MPSLGPISRRDLIAALRRAGFEGPFQGSDHQLMMKDNWRTRVKLPNPHRGEIGIDLVKKVLRQAGISREEWETL